jgi:hypothetical protein
VLTYGEFEHYVRNDVPCFYGPALVAAYHAEKEIKCTGLIPRSPLPPVGTEFFRVCPFDGDWAFTFVTQGLTSLRTSTAAIAQSRESLPKTPISAGNVGPRALPIACAVPAACDRRTQSRKYARKYANALSF